MNDQHDYDLFYHALNYRGAQFGATPELAWQELLACHNRIVARAVEQSEKDTKRLDWLENSRESHGFCHTGYGEYRYYTFKDKGDKTARETIDAAMLSEARK